MRAFLIIEDLEKSITEYKKYRKKSLDEIDSCYELLNNVDSAWVDSASDSFLLEIRKDYEKMRRYFSYLDNFFDLIEAFKFDIVNLISNYGYNDIKSLNYKSDRIQECVNYICDAAWYLSDALSYMNSIVYPSDFCELKLVDHILNYLHWYKDDLNTYSNNVCNFSNDMLDLLYSYKTKRNSLSEFSDTFKKLGYSWKNAYLNESKIYNTPKIQNNTLSVVSRKNNVSTEEFSENVYSNVHNAELDVDTNKNKYETKSISSIGNNTIDTHLKENSNSISTKNIDSLGDNTIDTQLKENKSTTVTENKESLNNKIKEENVLKNNDSKLASTEIKLDHVDELSKVKENEKIKMDVDLDMQGVKEYTVAKNDLNIPKSSTDIELKQMDTVNLDFDSNNLNNDKSTNLEM